jgi:hypothetical protein
MIWAKFLATTKLPVLGLKRKFSFSYFRENFAKIYFRFSQKKLTKSYENNENFRENEHFRETKFRENLLIFASFSIFAKMEKTVFVSTLTGTLEKTGPIRIRKHYV